MKTKKKCAFGLVVGIVLLLSILAPTRASAEAVLVSNFNDLVAALGNSESNFEIIVTNQITMTDIIEIPGGKNVVISSAMAGAGLTRGEATTGDLITVASGAKLTLSDIVIDGNKGVVEDARGSLVRVLTNGEFVLESGAVLQNNQRSILSARGGGVFNEGLFIMNDGAVKNNYTPLTGGGIYSTGIFKMYAGVVSGNSTRVASKDGNGQVSMYMCYGGGISIFGAGKAEIYGGTISNNSSAIGAGIYVNFGTTLTVYNALISRNRAFFLDTDGLGGGLWICGTGDAAVHDFRSSAIFDNFAGKKGGQDIYSQEKENKGALVLSNALLGGGAVDWLDETNAYASLDTSVSWSTLLRLRADVSQEDKDMAADAATVFITDNIGFVGGGMGINGVVYFGQTAPKTIDLVVKKEWVDDSDAKHSDIVVYLVIDGQKQDDISVVLNQGNGWKNTFTNLPYKVDGNVVRYTVQEEVPQGYIAAYTGPYINLEEQYEIIITNTRDRVALHLEGTKILMTADGVEVPVNEEEFVFTLTPDENNPVGGCAWSGSNPTAVFSGGAIDFGTLAFTEKGVYVFVISERDLGAEEIIYDRSNVTVTVVVDMADGRLKIISVTYSKEGQDIDGIRFMNKIDDPVLGEERPETGDSGGLIIMWLLLLILAMVGCGVFVAGFRKRMLE